MASIHHLALRTKSLDALLDFYTEVLACEVVRRQEHSIWLALEHGVLMLERAADPEPAIPEGSMDLLAFRVPPEELAELEHRLLSRGIAIEGRTAYTLYFRDPDGRRVAVSYHPLLTQAV